MVDIAVRPDERAQGFLDAGRHAEAVRALREDGIVVLSDVVSLESIAALRERSLEDTRLLLARKDTPFNWNVGNLQQDPPPFPPYLFRDVLVNDVVISVTKAILGAGLKSGFYSGNTALPSEARQPVHADEGQLWPDLEVAPPAHSLVVNVPLVDMGPENGSTEMWPGTHLDTEVTFQSGNIEVSAARLEARRAVSPPLQPVVRAGSMVIRDIRMWHAGMPNRTQSPRPMIAMIHSVAWWPAGRLTFAEGSQAYLEHPDLRWQVDYTDAPIDHIASPGGHMAPK
ncbi:MAG: phytanoyl-CoA dioxygenase family protein [Fimbriimonas sp.]